MQLSLQFIAVAAIAISAIHVNSAYVGNKCNRVNFAFTNKKFMCTNLRFYIYNPESIANKAAGAGNNAEFPSEQETVKKTLLPMSDDYDDILRLKMPLFFRRFCRRCFKSPTTILFESGLQWGKNGRARALQQFPWLFQSYNDLDRDYEE